MSGQPTMVTSRRRQRELLAIWPTWTLRWILVDPSAVQTVRQMGWSGTHHRDEATGTQIAATEDGLGFGLDPLWRNPVEVIPWSQLAELAREVPHDAREALEEFGRRWSEHQGAYPRFHTTSPAPSCAEDIRPNWRETYERELAEFEASGVLPAWENERAVLEAEGHRLLMAALEPAPGAPAADLLDLLEDQTPGLSATAEPVEPRESTPLNANATNTKESPVRIRNYTDQQRSSLENLRLPEQFSFTCEQKTAHSSERVVFTYAEADRFDSVILDVDDRSRSYLDAGSAVLVARAHHRYGQQARNPQYTEEARAGSSRAADALELWLATHPSLEVKEWQATRAGVAPGVRDAMANDPAPAVRPTLQPPSPRPRDSAEQHRPASPGTGVAR